MFDYCSTASGSPSPIPADSDGIFMANNEPARMPPRFLKGSEGLPALPEAFRQFDYDGWLPEFIKRFQLEGYRKTQAKRQAVLRQINEIQRECLAIHRNEREWQHLAQEDRIRQKRLDLDEIELDYRVEDLLYERQKKIQERQRAAAPASLPRARDLVEEITEKLQDAVRTEAAVKKVFDQARQQYPNLKVWLDDWEQKLGWDLKERKWF
jgi:hypothetical protein